MVSKVLRSVAQNREKNVTKSGGDMVRLGGYGEVVGCVYFFNICCSLCKLCQYSVDVKVTVSFLVCFYFLWLNS